MYSSVINWLVYVDSGSTISRAEYVLGYVVNILHQQKVLNIEEIRSREEIVLNRSETAVLNKAIESMEWPDKGIFFKINTDLTFFSS